MTLSFASTVEVKSRVAAAIVVTLIMGSVSVQTSL
jgi:hypothetical protein